MGLAYSLNIITLGPNPSCCMYQFLFFFLELGGIP